MMARGRRVDPGSTRGSADGRHTKGKFRCGMLAATEVAKGRRQWPVDRWAHVVRGGGMETRGRIPAEPAMST